MQQIAILGSTGSIGTSTLDVIRRNRERFQVHALAAGANVDLLLRQIGEFQPRVVVVGTNQALDRLLERLPESGLPRAVWPELGAGGQALLNAAIDPEVHFVMSAIVGVAGLEATYEAVRRGKRLGLANKEVMVAAGQLVTRAAHQSGAAILPVDSEHNGAHQCLRAGLRSEVRKLILTASGGPFRDTPAADLETVTPQQALNHPTWKMGPRITIDSATLMNKGFEVIEACWLFDFPVSDVEVVVHPQSTVHAMVEYADGSVIAQVCATDMRMPIQYALTYPARDEAPVPRLNWAQARTWEFYPPDLEKFRLLKLSYQAQETGGSATCTLNAADEIAVEAFLAGEIPFPAIAEIVEDTLNEVPSRQAGSIGEVLEIDRQSRQAAQRACAQRMARAV
ncbi:MAG: 1-deoxy-D-xylulose-5-phosphate reductoisomerase [Bryobacteraceae bacterium]|nr:1-deoxy-D-xylulose-5-phosphate reductoisomerase [Bryobacteraceae bacterium]